MNILCIGGAGFCGSNLAIHLSKQGHKVTVMDNLVRRGSELNIPKFKDYDIEFIHGDIRNPEDLGHLPFRFDVILNTAAQPAACTGYYNPLFDINNNYMGCLNVLEYARRTGSKIIFWSTNKVYSGEAINKLKLRELKNKYQFSNNGYSIPEDFSIDGGSHSIYGVSKACADLTCQEWAKAYDMPIIVNRFSCLAGPGQFGKSEQGWVTWFVIAALFNLPVDIYGFNGKQVRDVLFVPDMLRLIDIQIDNIDKYKGHVFNCGGGSKVNTSLIECIDLIEKLTDKKIKWYYKKEQRKSDQCVYISNISKAKSLLGWEPKVGMKEGIISIIDWVNNNEKELKKLYGISV